MSSKLYNEFYTALQQRYHSNIRLLINKGVSVNHQFEDGSFPLHIAAAKQDLYIVKTLLAFRASPDLKNNQAETALLVCINHITQAEKDIEIVHALINKKANVNSYDSQQRTALHIAAAKGLPSVVLTLLNWSARVDSQDKWQRTPLHMVLLNMSHNSTSHSNYTEVVKILLLHNSDTNKPDRHQATPLYIAANHGDNAIDIVQLLLKSGALPDRRSRHNRTPVMVAVLKGHERIVRKLLSLNCNVTLKYFNSGKSCFFTAVNKGWLNISILLLHAGIMLQEERWLYDSSCIDQITGKFPHMKDFLTDVTTKPSTLTNVCRVAIRRWYGQSLNDAISNLEYPQKLKCFILLHEM